jgi:hypothetical protein
VLWLAPAVRAPSVSPFSSPAPPSVPLRWCCGLAALRPSALPPPPPPALCAVPAGFGVWVCGVARPLPLPRRLCFSAFRAGGLRSLLIRPGRSGAAVVLVAVFSSSASASSFAARWAVRLGQSVVVRSSPAGWAVSVPVSLPSFRRPPCFGRVICWSGGLRGFVRALGAAGLVLGRGVRRG